jgi:penicillin-binding protein 1C
VWAAVAGYLHRRVASTPPVRPTGVIRTRVTFEQALEPARDEWFLRGTQMPVVALSAGARGDEAANALTLPATSPGAARTANTARTATATTTSTTSTTSTTAPAAITAPAATSSPAAAPRIGAPADGTLFALDPDIPPANQRIAFERANGTSTHSVWQLDGKRLGDAQRVLWPPWPGRHILELVDANGRIADSVRFEVRGATARAGTATATATATTTRSDSSHPRASATGTSTAASSNPSSATLGTDPLRR